MNLQRFERAQNGVYDTALKEIRNGDKRSHWMWFVFPQLRGLGKSEMATFYGIADLNEAKAYLAHPVLGARLLECCEAVLLNKNKTAHEIFGGIDAKKLRSSMTLFLVASDKNAVFQEVLDRFYGGKKDGATLKILNL
ncbi:MAG: DUF1810 domain-containing protein [Clostridia bacterium]|nr:DUF1810 domain-containing protein [Clostridia bacterium]